MVGNIYNFSVLMSVYEKDNPLWLKEAIESIINQTVKPSEIIVAIDGQIPAKILNILKYYESNIKFFKNIYIPKNKGRGCALQQVLPLCSYELIAIMDADDINLPNRFETLLSAFNKYTDLSVVGGYIQEIDCNTKKNIAIRKVPLNDKQIKQFAKTRSPFNHVTVMFKKNDILKAGNYQSFYCLEDYYLWIRMIANNFTMINIPQVLVNVRIDKQMFKRRGGYKYFKNNKILSKEMLKLGIINYPFYIFNITIRFIIQVLMPNKLREFFYRGILRR